MKLTVLAVSQTMYLSFARTVRLQNVRRNDECVEYPCNALAEYREKYVNKCNQVTRDCGNGINEQQKKKEKN